MICNFCRVYHVNSQHYTRCIVYKYNLSVAKESSEKCSISFPVAIYDECASCYSKLKYAGQKHDCPDPREPPKHVKDSFK